MRTQILILAIAVFEIATTLQRHWGIYEKTPDDVIAFMAYVFIFSIVLDIIKK